MAKILSVHTPTEMKNLAINGAFDFWQEKLGTTTTVNTATQTSGYIADMIKYGSGGPSVKNYSVVRSTDVPTPDQSGFDAVYSTLFTQITGIPTLAVNDYIEPFYYVMEGYDYSNIHGKKVTYSFWTKSSVAGTYSFSLRNSSSNRSYVTTYTVNQANTWEFKSITVQMDTQGTWDFSNLLGVRVDCGTLGNTALTSTLNQWQTGNFAIATTATNWAATSGATIRFAMFSIVEGTLGFGPKGFQRAGKSIQQELAMCQRYYEKSYSLDVIPSTATLFAAGILNSGNAIQGGTTSTTLMEASYVFKVEKRGPSPLLNITFYDHLNTANTISRINSNIINNGGQTVNGVVVGTSGGRVASNSGPAATSLYFHYIADARL